MNKSCETCAVPLFDIRTSASSFDLIASADDVLTPIASNSRLNPVRKAREKMKSSRYSFNAVSRFAASESEIQKILSPKVQKILSSLSEEEVTTATTADIIRDVVKTNSKLSEAKVSWHDLLKSEDAHDESGSPLYGKANAFISHTWRYRFKDTAESVIKYAQDFEQETGRQCYIWMDMFLLNQFSTDSFDPNWLKETFTNVIKDINNTVVIMTPFESPASVKRVWCLWELYLSIQYSKLNIVLPPEQSIRFNDALLKDPYSVTEMYMQIGQIRAEEAGKSERN